MEEKLLTDKNDNIAAAKNNDNKNSNKLSMITFGIFQS